MNFFKNIAYAIDASRATTPALTLLQLVGGILLVIYDQSFSADYKKIIFIGLISSYAVVFLILLIQAFFDVKFGTLKLYLRRENGILFDTKARFRNVSLRVKTIQLIMTRLSNSRNSKAVEKALYDTGYEVGTDFYNRLVDHLKQSQKSFDALEPENKMKIWLDYDSSSGMGKFSVGEITRDPKLQFEIKVVNAFTRPENETPKEKYDLCEFLSGYIAGICTNLFKRNLKVKEVNCAKDSTFSDCKFEISQK
jgi:predicted hydrocarbon binding protein